MYIFLDESGDLGFNFKKKKTSKFFVITILFVQNEKPIEKIVKRIFKNLKKKDKKKRGILHAYKEKPITRKRLLRQLVQKNCKILTICLNKKKVYANLQNEKPVLYNYVTNILLDRTYTKKLVPIYKKIELIASKKETSKFLNENFKRYIRNKIKSDHKLDLEISIKTPFQEKALQIVDFVSWAIFRKYEHKDDSYYQIIKKKIVEENFLFE